MSAETLAASVVSALTQERPCWAERPLRRDLPRLLLQAPPGAWETYLAHHAAALLEIARQRGAEAALRRRAAELEEAGLWRPEADLDAWVEVVAPTFCIGPEMYRLRYGMLPAEILEEEIAMEERQERASALASYVGSLQRGQDPEDGGFLHWFLDEGREEELRTLLEAEKKVQRGLWPEWEDEESLQQWIGHLEEDWQEEYALVEAGGGSELECAQAVAGMMSRVRSRSIINAAARLGYDKIRTDYGASGKLAQER